jgi:drug/metabolite transporter (DMT)-like permease
VIAFFLWNLSIKNIGPQRTSLFGNLLPVFSTIEAALILNEKINYITIISLVIIFTGILIANASIFFHKKTA